jgi:hypothetical protein
VFLNLCLKRSRSRSSCLWNLSKKLGPRRSVFVLSLAELRPPPSLEGAIAEIDGLMNTRP